MSGRREDAARSDRSGIAKPPDDAARSDPSGMTTSPDHTVRGNASRKDDQRDGGPVPISSSATGRPLTPSAVRWGPDQLVPGIVQDVRDGTVLMVGYLDAEALAATLATGLVHFHSRSRRRLWRKGETSGNELHLRDLRLDCDGDALLLRVEPTGPTCHTGARSCFDAAGKERPAAWNQPAATDGQPAATTDGQPAARERPAATDGQPAAGEQPAAADGQPAAGNQSWAAGTQPAAGPNVQPQGFSWLEELWATIRERTAMRPAGSYTARLLDGGVDAVARKVTEEATEVLMAAKDDAVADRSGEMQAGAHADRRHETRAALAGEMADLLYHFLVLAAERDLPPAEVMTVLRARHRR